MNHFLILITNFSTLAILEVYYYFRPVDMGIKQELVLNGLDSTANTLLESYPLKRLFAFFGEMGVGKTTFIKAICKAMGVIENISSPTFALVNEYADKKGEPVYHFDFYRIENEQEAIDIGVREYFYSGHYCFIEWPEKILHLLPEDTIRVYISIHNDTRIIATENG
jgi:tRNA threonylcarbamoyladenosine biosynthesis protein TsaE